VTGQVIYRKAFFDLQLEFAAAVATDTRLPLARAVREYTNVCIRFGLGHAFDPAHPAWCAYTAGLDVADDPGEWTYRFYLGRGPDAGPPNVVATFGCFAYASTGPGRIRLHFANADDRGRSPLAAEAQAQRREELAALFEHIRRMTSAPPAIIGASWLYNLEAYRRLFPPSYLATAQVLRGRFQRMPLWGQFVDRDGGVRERPAAEFRARLARRSRMDGLDACFPLPVLGLEAPADAFYEFHGI